MTTVAPGGSVDTLDARAGVDPAAREIDDELTNLLEDKQAEPLPEWMRRLCEMLEAGKCT